MIDKMITRLEREGKLARQEAGIVQVEALLRQAIMDLEEAKKTLHVADRATYILAYMAMLKAGRALLLFKGYRPTDGAQHKTVVEMTGAFLGSDFTSLVNHFETMRRKRNEMTYEAGALLSPTEASDAFTDAIALVREIHRDVKAHNPQMELDF